MRRVGVQGVPYVHTGEDVQSALAELLSEVQMFTAPVEHRLLARRRFLDYKHACLFHRCALTLPTPLRRAPALRVESWRRTRSKM